MSGTRINIFTQGTFGKKTVAELLYSFFQSNKIYNTWQKTGHAQMRTPVLQCSYAVPQLVSRRRSRDLERRDVFAAHCFLIIQCKHVHTITCLFCCWLLQQSIYSSARPTIVCCMYVLCCSATTNCSTWCSVMWRYAAVLLCMLADCLLLLLLLLFF